jgi:hypothetical protein
MWLPADTGYQEPTVQEPVMLLSHRFSQRLVDGALAFALRA